MLKRLFLFLVFGFSMLYSEAQTVILDHENANTTTVFQLFPEFRFSDVVPNPNPGGINTSANVGVFTKRASEPVWAGGFPNPPLQVPADFTSGSMEICVDVYMPHIGNLGLKLEQSTNGGPNWIRTVANTKVNEWETLCYNVAQPSIEGPFQPVFGFNYNAVVLFFDFGSLVNPDQTYYFDNVVVSAAGPPTPPPNPNMSPYCETLTYHFGNPAEVSSQIYLTIVNVDANTMKVEIESAFGDPVDFLLIPPPVGSAVISNEDFSVPGKISRTLTWAVPPTDVSLNVLWSKENFGGNWQLSPGNVTVPFLADCTPPNAIPTMGEWSLFYLALIMLIFGIVYVMQFQTQRELSVAGTNHKPVKFSLNQMPFDMAGFKNAFKIALTIVPFGFAFIYIVWGEIIFDDLIGMTMAVPLVSYLIYLLKK